MKQRSQQLAFDTDIYAQPDAEKPEKKPKKDSTRKPANKKKPAVGESLQPCLPGLSRRGRPRSPNPIPPAVRATESRKRRIEAGGKRIELLLDPAVAADLASLTDYYKITRGELLSRLIEKAIRQIRRKA